MEMNISSYDAKAYLIGTQVYSMGYKGKKAMDIAAQASPLNNPLQRYKYARFELQHERISKACELRLHALGVECLMDGNDFEAYGIVIDDDIVRELLKRDPEISGIEDEEPPAGK